MDYKQFFKVFGEDKVTAQAHYVSDEFTVEELYQAFKERLLSEQLTQNPKNDS